ncbi:MAG: N-acetyl-gamma-glutamyl-phosphate reductase [Candidatus Xiphinematobacter sp.]|nr:MAG: N-acetyl-gamma-glutamyl-phosphate reductase [Candidatus Xiphinematobacter sp.]
MERKRVGIVGASGYSGQELCALLARHRGVEIAAMTSRQYMGKAVGDVLPRLARYGNIASNRFSFPSVSSLTDAGVEVVFLALPHGLAAQFVIPLLEVGVQVIDISADFRLRDSGLYREFYGIQHPAPHLLSEAVYGLPEWHADEIRSARLVACPGCYPTSILLPLLPLLARKFLQLEFLCVASASGVSGAGRKPEIPLLFGECDDSFRAYGVPQHRHLAEIKQELSLAAGEEIRACFVPHLLPTHRGLHTTIFSVPSKDIDATQIRLAWEEDYIQCPFIHVGAVLPDTKHVSGTNFCNLAIRTDPHAGKLLLFSAIDNLMKGSAGQAVQCFNLMSGFLETEGLLP